MRNEQVLAKITAWYWITVRAANTFHAQGQQGKSVGAGCSNLRQGTISLQEVYKPMTSQAFYIGMDLGGTTFKAIAVTPEGRILERVQGETDAKRGPEAVVQHMLEAIKRLEAQIAAGAQQLKAVGFGVPGIIDLLDGVVRRSPNLPGWENYALREALSQGLHLPVAIENDANAAALGELWLGAARGVHHALMLTLGTGVGGGIISAGRIMHGAQGYAGELGHTVVDPNGPQCGCGSKGCLEQFASGTAIARMAEISYGRSTAKHIALAARRGEKPARDLYHRVGQYLGIACASFANIFNPERLIIGGAVADAFDLFIDGVQSTMRERTFPEIHDRLRVVQAQCGTDAGGLGAAYQAMQQQRA